MPLEKLRASSMIGRASRSGEWLDLTSANATGMGGGWLLVLVDCLVSH